MFTYSTYIIIIIYIHSTHWRSYWGVNVLVLWRIEVIRMWTSMHWVFDTLKLWRTDALTHRCFDTLVLWRTDALTHWGFGTLMLRRFDALTHWGFGTLMLWRTDALMHWGLGTLMLWRTEVWCIYCILCCIKAWHIEALTQWGLTHIYFVALRLDTLRLWRFVLPPPPPLSCVQAARTSEQLFLRIDINQDGTLTEQEFLRAGFSLLYVYV